MFQKSHKNLGLSSQGLRELYSQLKTGEYTLDEATLALMKSGGECTPPWSSAFRSQSVNFSSRCTNVHKNHLCGKRTNNKKETKQLSTRSKQIEITDAHQGMAAPAQEAVARDDNQSSQLELAEKGIDSSETGLSECMVRCALRALIIICAAVRHTVLSAKEVGITECCCHSLQKGPPQTLLTLVEKLISRKGQ